MWECSFFEVVLFSAGKTVDKLLQHYVWVNNEGGCVYVISAEIKTNCVVDDSIAAGDHVTCNITLGSWWYDDHNLDFQVNRYLDSYVSRKQHSLLTRLHVRTAKTQISLRMRAVWSESSQGTLRVAKEPRRLQAGSEDTDQHARMQSCRKYGAPAHMFVLWDV